MTNLFLMSHSRQCLHSAPLSPAKKGNVTAIPASFGIVLAQSSAAARSSELGKRLRAIGLFALAFGIAFWATIAKAQDATAAEARAIDDLCKSYGDIAQFVMEQR